MPIYRRGRARYRQDQAFSRSFRLNKHSPQAKGMIGWYPNGFGSKTIRDASGFAKGDGTLTGSELIWAARHPMGKVLEFDGSANNYVTFGDTLDIRTSDFSYGVWFRADWVGANESKTLIAKSKYAAATGRYWTTFFGGNLSSVLDVAFAGSVSLGTSETPYLDGIWHLAFTTMNRTGNMIFYVDGVAVDSGGIGADSAVDYNTAFPLGVGALQNVAGDGFDKWWFDGNLFAPRFYNRALSPSEIYQLFAPQTRWDLYEPIPRVFPVHVAAVGRTTKNTDTYGLGIASGVSRTFKVHG